MPGLQIENYDWIRFTFFIFNFIVTCLGGGQLVVGVWLQNLWTPYGSLLPTYSLFSPTTLIIIMGAIITVVGFFGAFGSLMENKCMLIVYFIFVFLMLLLEIIITVLGCTQKEIVQETVTQQMVISIRESYDPTEVDDEQGLVKIWDQLQVEMKCCGVNSYSDWYNIYAWPNKQQVPDSCCQNYKPGCGQLEPLYWHKQGCLAEVGYWFMKKLHVLGVIALTLAVTQILFMVGAMYLMCRLRRLYQ